MLTREASWKISNQEYSYFSYKGGEKINILMFEEVTSETWNKPEKILKMTSNCIWCSGVWRDRESESNEPR